MVDRLEERLRDAAPQPRSSPDVDALWTRGRQLRRRQHIAVGAFVAVVVVAVATVGASLMQVNDTMPPILDRPDGVTSPDPGDFDDGQAWQEAVLAAGEVTYDDYVRAKDQAAECIRAEGYEVRFDPGDGRASAPFFGADRDLFPDYGVVYDPDHDDARREDVMSRCHQEWAEDIQQAWFRQNTPSGVEQQEVLEQVWECAEQRGMELADPPNIHDAVRAQEIGCHPEDFAD